MSDVKRVVLKGGSNSRRGAYWRVRENGVTRYYKVRKETKTKESARKRFEINKAARFEKERKELPKAEAKEEYEEVKLHFRADYDKKGHEITIKDSYISASIPRSMSDDDAQQLLADLFEEAIAQDFGASVLDVLDIDMIKGIERTGGEPQDRVVINYQHGTGNRWRHIEKPIGKIRAYKTDEADFTSRVRK